MKEKGFTLIELLVVIGIISILSGIVIIAVNPARQMAQARNAARRSDILTILNAIQQYLIDQGSLPTQITTASRMLGTNTTACNAISCVSSPGNTTTVNCADLSANLAPTYLSAIPTDPTGDADKTGFIIKKDADGRVTVGACYAELTTNIFVTR